MNGKHRHHSPNPPHHQPGDEESFYGSTDVTNNYSCIAGDHHTPLSHSTYDNAGLTNDKQQRREAPGGVATSSLGYDNVQGSIQSTTSPRYDPVPSKMSVSLESNESERIYAEVTEDIVSRSQCDYEELNDLSRHTSG